MDADFYWAVREQVVASSFRCTLTLRHDCATRTTTIETSLLDIECWQSSLPSTRTDKLKENIWQIQEIGKWHFGLTLEKS